ncbi:LysR family transcriptional regulator [Pseudomonas asplenii]|uniref:LysR family transcriptional regulator n=1 Tax=Pseudomonas asplenii TaxID=53407 RepID=UPI0006CD0EE5|nr:LysR family transcriptional regulator [Pseudomonas fuscovaginae]KPA99769.1 transcriptional regulator, LysR family [Pseudomonas fuscovaginae]
MPKSVRSELADLRVFVTIMRCGSFRKAALELGVTTSALSHTIRKLEDRLGVRLLNRTTRTLVATPAGTALSARLEIGFSTIDQALGDLEHLRSFPIGKLRINMPQDASLLLARPVLAKFTSEFPQIDLEVSVEDRFVDIVAEGYDAGIRYGERVPKDMIAVPLTPILKWVVVASPTFLKRHGRPSTPQQLLNFPCILTRLGDGTLFQWELGNDERMLSLEVKGRICLNETGARINAAVDGVGFAYVLEEVVRQHITRQELEIVLPEWSSDGPPLCIYYPSRKQMPAGLRQLINMMRAQFLLPAIAAHS